ncbi:helix-turn-helix transcriptional regulator [Anaerotignum sp.]|uniref:helix-turn-helix transcriptional regulator n=1 Tax=Anaerotignum sp. TaxID=2039241 RepID=UPI002714AB90|nr:PAS domain-containing protein [Anaerotignum sp.]
MAYTTKILIQMAKAMSKSFGDICETVVRDSNAKIVYIENSHITNRKVGEKMEKSVLDYILHRAPIESDSVIRTTKKKDGTLLKSTTTVFFDESNELEAMICITIDMTHMNETRKFLDTFMNAYLTDEKTEENSMNIVDYTRTVISEIINDVGKPSTLGTKEMRYEIIKKLNDKGVFLIKDSVPQVCELLSMSQATLYNYLRDVRLMDRKTFGNV